MDDLNITMTYQEIVELKFRKKIPTFELHRIIPEECEKISRVALSELPVKTLRKLIRDEKKLAELLLIKKSVITYS